MCPYKLKKCRILFTQSVGTYVVVFTQNPLSISIFAWLRTIEPFLLISLYN